MSQIDELRAKLIGYREQMIEMQRQLVSVPALGPTNGGQGELAKCEVVQKWLQELGLTLERIDAKDSRVESGLRPNLTALWEVGSGPKVWVLSHLDVVPPGDSELWSSDPFQLRVEGERLYGRGVTDNHQGLVCSYFALKALRDLGAEPAGPVGLVVVSDEETGSAYGLDHLLKQRPELFSPQDLIIVPDAGEADGAFIEIAEKSMLWLKVVVEGKQTHASTPHRGVNALYAAARMIVGTRGVAARFAADDPLFNPPLSTFEATRKEAGVPNINTIPGRDVFYIDCRVLPKVDLAEVLTAFKENFGLIAQQEGVKVNLQVVQKLQAPPPTAADAPVVKALSRAIEQASGKYPRTGGVGGGTVAAFFRQRGLPAAVWSTSRPVAHMPDEYVELGDLVSDALVLALVYLQH